MADCLVKEVAKGAKDSLTEVIRSGDSQPCSTAVLPQMHLLFPAKYYLLYCCTAVFMAL